MGIDVRMKLGGLNVIVVPLSELADPDGYAKEPKYLRQSLEHIMQLILESGKHKCKLISAVNAKTRGPEEPGVIGPGEEDCIVLLVECD